MLQEFGWCLLLLFYLGAVYSRGVHFNETTSHKYYSIGVNMEIINTDKYSFESFLRDEQNVFMDLYKEYTSSNDSQPLNYKEWLVMNNFGILPDTQRSLFERKITKRSTDDNKLKFLKTVRKGDILITRKGKSGHLGGLIGHAAIMTSDNWVLEMSGGSGWENGIQNNNHKKEKDKWFDEHSEDWTTVYRCPDWRAAKSAADWAYHTFYNPYGGALKRKHIMYRITTDIWSINPSYCSKLVVHAYRFGTGKRQIINQNMMRSWAGLIVPIIIPKYFMPKYKLRNKGQF